jgi:hypothetical protein
MTASKHELTKQLHLFQIPKKPVSGAKKSASEKVSLHLDNKKM